MGDGAGPQRDLGPEPQRLKRLKLPESPLGRTARLAFVAGVFAGAVALRVPLCPFALVTRHPCPGCGLTRAAIALAQGDLEGAMHLHPLVLPIVPIIGAVLAHGSFNYIRNGRFRSFASELSPLITIGSIVLAAAMMFVWLSRFFGFFGGPVPV